MKKVASVFIIAVFVPSVILALLAIRSLRDQEAVLERQQRLLYQEIVNSVFKDIDRLVAEKQGQFTGWVNKIASGRGARAAAGQFDEQLRAMWPLAKVGFVVSLDGEVLAPSLFAGAEARRFRIENDRFLSGKETVEVYWNGPKGSVNISQLDRPPAELSEKAVFSRKSGPEPVPTSTEPAAFRQLIGEEYEGTLARYLQDELNLFFWTRLEHDSNYVFGAQINVEALARELGEVLQVEPRLRQEVAVGLLNEKGKAVCSSDARFDVHKAFLTADIGETLPHWKVGLAVLDQSRLRASVRTTRLTLGLLIAVLLIAIGTGSWLVVRDIDKQLQLARQKTDFVSNVSHELKTPLTSIRMFSELLENPKLEDSRRREFLRIVNNEASRLTRLINNVLDFGRMERGEQKYQLKRLDLVEHVRGVLEQYRPQLQAAGHQLKIELPPEAVEVEADPDAISQALLNLLSNAEKYGGAGKPIGVRLTQNERHVAIRVHDEGPGIPEGFEERVFEQFFRLHDSLSAGVPGSGLGLTLARRIARAHGGDVVYDRAGKCFELRVPKA